MAVIKESGIELVPGIQIPWGFFDTFVCGLIESGEEGINALAVTGVNSLDNALEKVVNNTSFQFDNIGKAKLAKAITVAMVKKYMPELNP